MKRKTPRGVNRKHVPKKRLRRLTAFEIQKLGILAEQLGALIPANSPAKNALSFKKIAREQGWNKHYKEGANKKETILYLLMRVHVAHPILLRRIIIENIPGAITRRHKNGSPVLKQEIVDLDRTLLALGHKITEELFSLDFPEGRPAIVPPTPEMQRALDKMSLNPVLLPDCAKLFKDGYLNDAVRKALEKFEKFVQIHSGLTTIGVNLMEKAFDKDNALIVVFSDQNEARRKGLQEGFQRLAMGSMGYWRNYCSHNDEGQMPAQDVFAIVATISHMIYKIQESQENSSGSN